MQTLTYLHDKYDEVIKFENTKRLKELYHKVQYDYLIEWKDHNTTNFITLDIHSTKLTIYGTSNSFSQSQIHDFQKHIETYLQSLSNPTLSSTQIITPNLKLTPDFFNIDLQIHMPTSYIPPTLKSDLWHHLQSLVDKIPHISSINLKILPHSDSLSPVTLRMQPSTTTTQFHLFFSAEKAEFIKSDALYILTLPL